MKTKLIAAAAAFALALTALTTASAFAGPRYDHNCATILADNNLGPHSANVEACRGN
jgi:hypothetical protein